MTKTGGSAPQIDGDDRRRRRGQAMLAAARDLFLEQGYDAVSLSDVVARSGGSLSTLYDVFGNKRGLLQAVMTSQFERDMQEFEGLLSRGGHPDEVLLEIALGTQRYLTNPEMIRFMRFVIGESLRSPEFGERFFQSVHVIFIDRYAGLFRDWNDQGVLKVTDPELAARQFISLILHDLHVRAIYRGPTQCSEEPDLREAQQAVAVFLAYYQR